ncbi:hypothetical protein P0O24_02005 [Methanotrichaceae archaeon M04Ac]|uniref:Uncharacterized protein n=1 Tax=Candidatus Methanocrinis alkalitolerans TaxID=3033395 RepID=A0ABT5XCI1_9EURY|nr:hypothetical protein [Candidatus Methanocrinis alkalitolerans]MCR3882842.1 hypothetical protein [Methanothrix sp.]MDF0592356.1 hypothetical protein [Candidatus Methanocrinis alkalitolerans]
MTIPAALEEFSMMEVARQGGFVAFAPSSTRWPLAARTRSTPSAEQDAERIISPPASRKMRSLAEMADSL